MNTSLIRSSSHLIRWPLGLLTAIIFLALSVASKFYAGPAQDFIRSSFADFLFVGAVYYFLRCHLFQGSGRTVAIFVFLLATVVEFLQLSGISKSPLMPHWLVFWIGDVFDISDLGMYGLGCLFAYFLDKSLPR